MNHKWLTLTSLFFLFPQWIYYKYCKLSFNKFLIIFLNKFTALFGILFWIKPIKNAKNHSIDRKWVRMMIPIMLLNIFTSSPPFIIKIIQIFIIICLGICITYSDYFSTIQWCSKQHITTHFISHLLFILLNVNYILF